MDKLKKERLEAEGWKVGTAADFLELTPEETIRLEIKFALNQSLRYRRQK
jgi:hypothetical protein